MSSSHRFGPEQAIPADRSFGMLLRHYRTLAGLTQEVLAERARLSARAISDLERGLSRTPQQGTLDLLAEALQLSAEERADFSAAGRQEKLHAVSFSTPPDVPADEPLAWPAGATGKRPSALVQQPPAGQGATPQPPVTRRSLPSPPPPLIGREQEFHAVCALLQRQDVRLLTVTGTAGVGKTRLALEVASACAEAFADGVQFVPLATLTDPEFVLPALAQALGVRETVSHPVSTLVQRFLHEQELLLVLDNFEQVIPAAAHVANLLTTCPSLKLLVTSRKVLHLRAEHLFPLHPLALPLLPTHGVPDSGAVGQNPSVQLFLQQAQAAHPDVCLTASNAATIAEICRHLEGIPLALELAAPRLKLLSPQALLARLEGRLQVLTGGARDLPERQRTMRATIQWSYDLLTPAEQALFRRLAVFVGGWQLSVAEQVCQAAGVLGVDVLEGLASLLDKSLIQQEPTGEGAIRFRLLSVLREFGLERLAEAGELAATCEAHATLFLALAEKASALRQSIAHQSWAEPLAQEQENLRAALNWWLERAGQEGGPTPLEAALRLAFVLVPFWKSRGALREAQQWYERALALRAGVAASVQAHALTDAADLLMNLGLLEHAEAHAQEALALAQQGGEQEDIIAALGLLGAIAQHQDRYEMARAWMEQEAALHQQTGNTRSSALCLADLSLLFFLQGEYERAQALLEESLAIFQGLGDQRRSAWVCYIQAWNLCATQGDLTKAAALAEESLEVFGTAGERWIRAELLCMLGVIRGEQGHLAEARALVEEGLAIYRESGGSVDIFKRQNTLARLLAKQGDLAEAHALYGANQKYLPTSGAKLSVAEYLEGWGLVLAALGAPLGAARLWGAAEALCAAIGSPMLPIYREEYAQAVATARTRLRKEAFSAAWTEGRGMTPAQALDAATPGALAIPTKATPTQIPVSPRVPEGLTHRELEVLRLLAQGLTDHQIAERLVISPLTVHTHLGNMYSKLGVTSRSAATRYALEHHLI